MKIDYTSVSKDFKDKYCRYFDGESLLEDVTQQFWYSMSLDKNRLARLGLKKRVRIHENGIHDIWDPQIKREIRTTERNGKKRTDIVTPVSVQNEYIKDGKIIFTSRDYYGQSRCSVLESDSDKGEFTCTYCGAIGTKESFIDGCDYCGAQFKVQDFSRKISGYTLFHDDKAQAVDYGKKNRIVMIAAILICAVLFVVSMQSLITPNALAEEVMFRKFASVFCVMTIVTGIILQVVRLTEKRECRERLTETPELFRLEEDMPEFDREEFVSSLDYRLKALHYTDTVRNMEMLFGTGYSGNIEKYKDVAECSFKNCTIEKYDTDETYRYIRVHVRMRLICYENGKMVTKEEPAELIMYTYKEIFPSESMVSCSCVNCGSSVNLLKGVCEQCGTRIDMARYGWTVSGYESGWDKNPKTQKKNHDKWMKRAVFIGAGIVFLLGMPTLVSGAAAGIEGFTKDHYIVYSSGNEIIPAFENYGYAIAGKKSIAGIGKAAYTYRLVGDYQKAMEQYADHLVKDDGFTVIERDTDDIILERKRKYGPGRVKVKIIRGNKKYTIRIE